MQRVAQKRNLTSFIAAAGLAAICALAAGVVGAPPAKAAQEHCRVFTSQSDFYEGGKVTSVKYTVPTWSQCEDINIRNISAKDENGVVIPGDHCATFTVQFFPSSGGYYYGNPKWVCSTGPNGAVVPIATNVINGTKYRVLYNIEELGRSHSFQIVD